VEYLKIEKQSVFSEKWMEEYGDTLPDGLCDDAELAYSVSGGASRPTKGGNCRAQVSNKDGKMAASAVKPQVWPLDKLLSQ